MSYCHHEVGSGKVQWCAERVELHVGRCSQPGSRIMHHYKNVLN